LWPPRAQEMAAAKPPRPAPITIMSRDEENIINNLSTLLSALHGHPQAALREELPTEFSTPHNLPKKTRRATAGKEHVKNCGKTWEVWRYPSPIQHAENPRDFMITSVSIGPTWALFCPVKPDPPPHRNEKRRRLKE
ncbi:hypothetical protein KCU74_g64, partial [Aureobasidium melanogenum]